MTREHCLGCDRPLGKHRFVSANGQRILCGGCFGAPRNTGSVDKKRLGTHKRGARR